MKKVILILLIVLGIADFLYGIFYQDRISIIAGAGIVFDCPLYYPESEERPKKRPGLALLRNWIRLGCPSKTKPFFLL